MSTPSIEDVKDSKQSTEVVEQHDATGPVPKVYISANSLLEDSYALALQILKSGYRPNYIVGVWRGGAPIGIAVQEYLDYFGVKTDHIAIRTSSYIGIGQRSKTVRVHGLGYLVERINAEDSLLLVDDVFDSGLSLEATIKDIKARSRRNCPELRTACVYFKPENNKSQIIPDYYTHKTSAWLVFPHEIVGLSDEELEQGKPELYNYIKQGKQYQVDSPTTTETTENESKQNDERRTRDRTLSNDSDQVTYDNINHH